jgi:hypothetical protein
VYLAVVCLLSKILGVKGSKIHGATGIQIAVVRASDVEKSWEAVMAVVVAVASLLGVVTMLGMAMAFFVVARMLVFAAVSCG